MIAAAEARVYVEAEQLGRAGERDARLLAKFADKRVVDALAPLDAATREMPAGV